MILIENRDEPEQKLKTEAQLSFPAMMFKSFRSVIAKERGIQHNILIRTQGGLGDVICAEPALRYAITHFRHELFSLDSYFPELFTHLNFRKFYNTGKLLPDYEKYHVFDTMHPIQTVDWEFIAHPFTHVVSHCMISMFACDLPVKDRSIQLFPSESDFNKIDVLSNKDILIHPGRTWQSRTVPGWFWSKVIKHILENNFRPVLVGRESYGMTGTEVVDSEGCLDLRNKLSIMETVAVCQKAKVLLTNDSSLLHMAASGNAWIGFMSTVKHPDFITHYRNGGEFGWRMKNHSGGMWEDMELCSPLRQDDVRFDNIEEDQLRAWLPNPKDLAEWSIEKHASLHDSNSN